MTGRWAATNTLREGIGAVEGDRDIGRELLRVQAAENAVALVEAALAAAEEVIRIESTGVLPDFMPLAAALRAVREGK